MLLFLLNLVFGISVTPLAWAFQVDLTGTRAAAKHGRKCVVVHIRQLTFETLSLHLISGLAIVIYTISESVSSFEKRGVRINSVQRDSLWRLAIKHRLWLSPNRYLVSGNYYFKWQYFSCLFGTFGSTFPIQKTTSGHSFSEQWDSSLCIRTITSYSSFYGL